MDWPTYQHDLARVLSQVSQADVESFASWIDYAYLTDRTVFVCGNGGSAANASHFAQDLAKGTGAYRSRTPLRAISLCDSVGAITAWANDSEYADVFTGQLQSLARPGDELIAISGSGNSDNVLRAVLWGNDEGLHTVAVTGFDGGKLKRLAQFTLHVPCENMGMVEAAHAAIFHHAVDRLREMWSRE